MADDQISQDEIEALLGGGGGGGGAAKPDPPEPAPAPEAPAPPDGDIALGQDEIEALISGGSTPSPPAAEAPAAASAPGAASPAAAAPAAGVSTHSDMEYLLNQAEAAIASIDAPTELPPGVQPFSLTEFSGSAPTTEAATIELVRDVQLDLKIELGRTHMHLEDVLRMKSGSVVPLDKMAGDPVDVFANGRLIARGEVLVLNDNFCVRITELVAGEAVA